MFQPRRTIKSTSLLVISVFLGFGCAGEDAEDGVEGTESEAVQAAKDEDASDVEEGDAPPEGAEGELGGATPDRVPIAGEGKERGRILGTIEVPGYEKGIIQLDAVVELEEGAKVIANERYKRPGPFRLVVRGDYEEVNLIAYLDLDDDGPTAGDLRYEYEGNPVSLAEGERIEGLIVTVVAEPEEAAGEPQPEGEGSEPGTEAAQEPEGAGEAGGAAAEGNPAGE
ncbi:MAG: hypothetical protein VX519_02400 [Myxococcota bacterium]|nr:hypothetical protein [Myxococcota bacterium]